MDKIIKDRIDAIRQGRIPKGYNRNRYILYPEDWGEPCPLYSVLTESKERNENLEYDKDDVLSVSGDYGVVNQIDLLGRSYAGESVAPYHIVYTGDIVYTKSPLKDNPHGIIKLNKGNSGIVSTLYAVYHCNNDITAQYIENYFCIDSYLNNYLKPIVKRGAKNDMKVNNEDVLTGVIPLPPLAEQEKISEILDHYDRLIKLCEAKVDEYKSLKKTCLSKMFPQNGSDVPEIRFPGFSGAWEQRKLGEVLSLLKDGTHGTHPDAENGPYLLSAKNIKDGQIIIDEATDRRISEEEYSKIHATFLLQTGDVLLTIVGSLGESAIFENGGNFTFQRSVAFLRPKEEIISEFLRTEISTNAFQRELDERKSQSAQPGIYLGELEKIPICFPLIEEQKRIGRFFLELDNLITLHQREVEEYTKLKKAMTQLLLTGIVRVK